MPLCMNKLQSDLKDADKLKKHTAWNRLLEKVTAPLLAENCNFSLN